MEAHKATNNALSYHVLDLWRKYFLASRRIRQLTDNFGVRIGVTISGSNNQQAIITPIQLCPMSWCKGHTHLIQFHHKICQSDILFDQLECYHRLYYCTSVKKIENMDQNNCSNEDSYGDESRNWVSNSKDNTNVTSRFPLPIM